MKRKALSAVYQTVCLLLGLILIFPIIYAFLISFMGQREILTKGIHLIPNQWQLNNYKEALRLTPLVRYMFNSLVLSGVSSAVRVIVASLAAFSFAFFTYKGKNFLFMLCMTTMMIPGDVVLITNYKTVASLGLTDTYVGMMAMFFVSVMNIFMFRQYYLSFSKELYDAAKVDGCANLVFFVKILLPLSRSVISTVFISSFVSTWNTYLWPMLVTNDDRMRTVQVGITMLNSKDGGTVYGPIMAASVMVLVPTIVVFVLFQKQIAGGMMAGSVKG